MKSIVLTLVVVLFLLSCKGNQSTKSRTITSYTDTIVSDSLDSMVKTTEICFVGDGHTFDIKGKVKEIRLKNGEGYEASKMTFDPNGKYVPMDEWDIVERNGMGQIKCNRYDDGGGYNLKYEYSPDGKVLTEHIIGGMSRGSDLFQNCEATDISLQYEYEGDNVSAITATYRFDEGNYIDITNPKSFSTKFNVEILSTDSKGNWTQRKITGKRITIGDNGFEIAGSGEGLNEETGECYETEKYYSKEQISVIEKREITYYEESNGSSTTRTPDRTIHSSSTSSNNDFTQREKELLEENKRLCNEWGRYEEALRKATKEFDYNYRHGYQVVTSFSDMQFYVNKLSEIASSMSRIDPSSGKLFKEKADKYQDALEYCREHSGYYR